MNRLFNDEYVVWFKTVKGRLPKQIPTCIDENGNVLWISRISKSRRITKQEKRVVIKREVVKQVKLVEEIVEQVLEKVEEIRESVKQEVVMDVEGVVEKVERVIRKVVKKGLVCDFTFITYKKYLEELKNIHKEVKNGFWTKYDIEVMKFSFM